MNVLCIGLAVMDITARCISQKDQWQEKQSIEEIGIQLGGDAVNQGVYLTMLGMDCGLNICVGADSTGQMLKASLEQKGVDTSMVCVREGGRTGTSMILVDREGERRIFSASGAERGRSGWKTFLIRFRTGLRHYSREPVRTGSSGVRRFEDYLARARKGEFWSLRIRSMTSITLDLTGSGICCLRSTISFRACMRRRR